MLEYLWTAVGRRHNFDDCTQVSRGVHGAAVTMQYAKQKRRRSLCQLRRPSIQLLALTVAMVARQASSLFVHVIHRGNSSSRYSAVSPGLYASNEDIQQQRQQSSSKTPITVPSWSDYFQALVKFRNECGHSHVPKRHTTTISATSLQFSDTPQIESSNIISIQLGAWVSRQRLRKDRLHADQISLLDSIGFCWNAHGDKDQKINEQWWKRFRDIQETRHQCLQTSTLQSLPPLEEGLSASQLAWLRRQRNDYVDYYQLRYTTTCKLNAEQLQALSELDPEWHMTPRERQWQTQFQALEEFQKENGQ
jgi:hypothetical protein